MIQKEKYLFVAKFEFESFDDIDAKQKAKMLEKAVSNLEVADWQFKLQRLKDNKMPEKVEFH